MASVSPVTILCIGGAVIDRVLETIARAEDRHLESGALAHRPRRRGAQRGGEPRAARRRRGAGFACRRRRAGVPSSRPAPSERASSRASSAHRSGRPHCGVHGHIPWRGAFCRVRRHGHFRGLAGLVDRRARAGVACPCLGFRRLQPAAGGARQAPPAAQVHPLPLGGRCGLGGEVGPARRGSRPSRSSVSQPRRGPGH